MHSAPFHPGQMVRTPQGRGFVVAYFPANRPDRASYTVRLWWARASNQRPRVFWAHQVQALQ